MGKLSKLRQRDQRKLSVKGVILLLIFMSGLPVYNDINAKDPVRAQKLYFL